MTEFAIYPSLNNESEASPSPPHAGGVFALTGLGVRGRPSPRFAA